MINKREIEIPTLSNLSLIEKPNNESVFMSPLSQSSIQKIVIPKLDLSKATLFWEVD